MSILSHSLFNGAIWATLAVVLFTSFSANAAKPRPPIPVTAESVTTEPFVATIEALGTLKARESVTLSALVTKTIQAIHFDDGQRVEQGAVLVEMASREEQALLAEAEYTASEAQRQYTRVKSLHKRKLASDASLDERRTLYDTAQAKLEAVQARLADRTIIAPFSGVMGLRQVSLGTLVRPGDVIATLDDDRVMKLDIAIPAVYLSAVQVGMNIEAKASDLRNKVFPGTLASIDSRIDPNTRTITLRALLDNTDRELISGMLMNVSLQQPPIDSIMIPEEALVQEGSNSFVYVIENSDTGSNVSKRSVDTAARTRGKVVIRSGLNAGEIVVTRGTMRLSDGSAVSVQTQARAE